MIIYADAIRTQTSCDGPFITSMYGQAYQILPVSILPILYVLLYNVNISSANFLHCGTLFFNIISDMIIISLVAVYIIAQIT